MAKHIVTKEEMDANPDLTDAGVTTGDEIEIEDTKPEEPAANTNEKQAEAIFAAMPHIHTIWFDENGGWRFYETPGTVAISRPTQTPQISITDL